MIRQAINSKLSGSDLKVLLAVELGYDTVYDIQNVTGLQRCRILKSLEVVQNARVIINNNRFISILRSSTVQNAQNPPSQIYAYLASTLNRTAAPTPADKLACKRLYLRARSLTSSSETAVQLVKDCIDTNSLDRANYPAIYLQRVFDTYLASMPREMPLNVWEQQERDHFHRRWNNLTRQWERTEVRIDPS